MSNIGFVGLGKLGLPSALAIESKGHTVVGYDLNPNVKQYIEKKTIPYLEQSVPELLQKTKIEVLSLAEVLKRSEIIFVAVQTPHCMRELQNYHLQQLDIFFIFVFYKITLSLLVLVTPCGL